MGLEIERKFLVVKENWTIKTGGTPYMQAYILSSDKKVVRVRLEGNTAKLTIKAEVSDMTRREYEYTIPKEDALEMLEEVCDSNKVIKKRFHVKVGGKIWDVDFFEGRNQGLAVAEIELESEQEDFEMPDWAGEEVTKDRRYYNAALAKHPFSEWS